MDPATFNKLAEIVRPDIEKLNTNYRKSIPYQMRLSITLYFLATGYYKYIFTIIYIYVVNVFNIKCIIYLVSIR